jgi:hypothetical protein
MTNINDALSKLGGVDANTITTVPRMILGLDGLEKSGKTHFSLTAPDPIGYISLDVGLEGVIHKFKHKRIQVFEYDIPLPTPDEAEPVDYLKIWGEVRRTYTSLLNTKEVKTMVVDTGTELWELNRLARFGKLSNIKPHHYGPVNAEHRQLIKAAFNSNKNLILIHRLKDQYVNDKRTGELERAGFSGTGFQVQCNARAWWDDDEGEFKLTVTDSRHNPKVRGLELSGGMVDFGILGSMVMG